MDLKQYGIEPRRINKVEILQVVAVTCAKGDGKTEPVHEEVQYWSMGGDWLATRDAHTIEVSDQLFKGANQ